MNLDCGPCVVRNWRMSDIDSLLRHADNRKVWLNVGDRFPHPYTKEAAHDWCTQLADRPHATHWAIDIGGDAVGGVGMDIGDDIYCLTAHFGYWLGEDYWGRGIMTAVVGSVADYVLEHYRLARLQAPVFEWNPASMRVLEKCGFEREAVLRNGAFKDGRVIDTVLYARTAAISAGRTP